MAVGTRGPGWPVAPASGDDGACVGKSSRRDGLYRDENEYNTVSHVRSVLIVVRVVSAGVVVAVVVNSDQGLC